MAKCQISNQVPGEVETELLSLWSLMRFLSLRLKPKAAATPRMGSGPGTEDVRVTSVDKSAFMVRVPEPVKSRNIGKARESAVSTPTRGSALISAMENSVTPVRPKSEVGAFYWTVLAPDNVNPGREEQGSISV